MGPQDLERCDRLMSERDHLSGIGTDEMRRRIHLNLADEVPGLVAEIRRLWAERRGASDERERILGIVAEEASHYSRALEPLVPAQIALVFANAVAVKVSMDRGSTKK